MQYKTACGVLGLQSPFTQDQIKKQYRLKALQYHPDKCDLPDAASRFTEIHDAYEFLLRYEGYQESDDNQDQDEDQDASTSTSSYQHILTSFLKNVLKNESRNQLFYTILQRISSTCEEKTLRTLEQLDKQTLLKIYDFLTTYWQVLHFSENILQKIQEIIKSKVQKDECILLNPTLDDLFDNNLYKLAVGDFNYIVPLWHHELVYDNSGGEVIVKCYPVLEEHVYIDDQNNVHVEVEANIADLWNQEVYVVPVGKREFRIVPSALRMTPHQTVTLLKEGISLINTKDVYDVSKRGNVYVHLDLVMK
jgi:DnaJ-class molecular chaperone